MNGKESDRQLFVQELIVAVKRLRSPHNSWYNVEISKNHGNAALVLAVRSYDVQLCFIFLTSKRFVPPTRSWIFSLILSSIRSRFHEPPTFIFLACSTIFSFERTCHTRGNERIRLELCRECSASLVLADMVVYEDARCTCTLFCCLRVLAGANTCKVE